MVMINEVKSNKNLKNLIQNFDFYFEIFETYWNSFQNKKNI